MRHRRWLLGCTIAILLTIFSYAQASRPQQVAPAAGGATSAHRAVLTRYCQTCHNDRARTAQFTIESLDFANPVNNAEEWEKVIRKLRAGVMPPPGAPRPTWDEQLALSEWLETSIDRASTPNSGVKGLHRLNRTEYANAIRDLLDLEIDPEQFLPRDDTARGLDNIAGSLTISPTLLESYMTAAASIARLAVGYWGAPTQVTYVSENDASQTNHVEGQPLGTRGGLAVQHMFRADGEYRFSVQPFDIGRFIPGQQVLLTIDGEIVDSFPYVGVASTGGAERYEGTTMGATVPVKAGAHTVGVTFPANNYVPSLDMVKHHERTSLDNWPFPQLQVFPGIGLLRIEGPFAPTRPTDTPSIRKVFTCRPADASQESDCAREIISKLARRAYRRPESEEDLETLLSFYDEGRRAGTFEDGIELALQRLLVSPQFLVRTEVEPANVPRGQRYRITDLELASRLSFFLWSTIPDDELIDLASRRQLSNPTVLEQQVRRMLSDPRSEALVKNFGGQWLQLRRLSETHPDGLYFPDWDDEVRNGFRRETELLFESILREDRSILDLLTADYTFINERLAKHYGIPNVYGSHFRRVTLGADFDYRRGLLGKGSFLAVTFEQNTRTSPVKRGVWVLENLLGSPPPEPPPNVPPLEESTSGREDLLSLRDQLSLHMRNEPCKSCHSFMDPIGYSLENFDASGKWRTRDRSRLPAGWVADKEAGTPINAQATLYDGTVIDGPVQLREALLRYSPQFVRNVTERLMMYGLGRGSEYFDMPVIRAITRDAGRNDYKFSSIVLGIVKSDTFLMRTKSEAGSN